MFTSGATYPPNWDTIITDISNKKIQYLPLWSGKSSHFKVIFEASDFDFAKTSLEADSSEALIIASQVTREFSPAHAIPSVNLAASASDYGYYGDVHLPIVDWKQKDFPGLYYTSAAIQSSFFTSSYAIPTYRRGQVTDTAGSVFRREDTDSYVNSFLTSGEVIKGPRRNHRRRDKRYSSQLQDSSCGRNFSKRRPSKL